MRFFISFIDICHCVKWDHDPLKLLKESSFLFLHPNFGSIRL
ncbi:hypothetical protein PH5382_02145 [Phaeobacter sp. CECT 5382]|nr:hypothetical protein PH5382_02145 [Phaeobacter sp. CECT 5382]